MTLELPRRPRRNRKDPVVRGWARETELRTDHLILPLFVHGGTGTIDIASMPGQKRHDADSLSTRRR